MQKLKNYFIIFLTLSFIYSCQSSKKDSIKEEKQSLRSTIDSLQKNILSRLLKTEQLVDSAFAGNDSLLKGWRESEGSKRTIVCIDQFQDPFASHQNMVRMQIGINKSSSTLFFSSFNAYCSNHKNLLLKSDSDFLSAQLEESKVEIEVTFNTMELLAAQYEDLVKTESK